jgi:hypothetical protein
MVISESETEETIISEIVSSERNSESETEETKGEER